MNRKWKILFSLVLFTVSGVLFATLRPEKPAVAIPVEVPNEIAADAERFTRELLELARKNDQKNFAERCYDISRRSLAVDFRELRRLKPIEQSSWDVIRESRNSETYLVRLIVPKEGAYHCILRRDPDRNEWKFHSLQDF